MVAMFMLRWYFAFESLRGELVNYVLANKVCLMYELHCLFPMSIVK